MNCYQRIQTPVPTSRGRPSVNQLWHSDSPSAWSEALDHYWSFVKPQNMELELALDTLDLDRIRCMGARDWYDFLKDEYFRWKYSAPNRYGSTTKQLKRYEADNEIDVLNWIRLELLELDPSDIRTGLAKACSIRGLGTAGGSGLLSLMYPQAFATVDQFVVKALWDVEGLSEAAALARMRPEGLTLQNGVVLSELLCRKAAENNFLMKTDFWTPRKVDMVLWTYGR
jgi:hypothetical protein